MIAKLLAKYSAATLLFAALAYPQSATKTAKTPDENRATANDQATREAQRQGRVALTPEAGQSPTETMDQAIAFERYKELAAEREARKEAKGSEADRSADRSIEKPKPVKAKPPKKQ